MTGMIALDFDVLNDHAQKVDQLASDVSHAAGSLRSGGVSDRAFGTFGSFLVAAVQDVGDAAAAASASAQMALGSTADELRAVAEDARELEQSIAASLRAIELGAGGPDAW